MEKTKNNSNKANYIFSLLIIVLLWALMIFISCFNEAKYAFEKYEKGDNTRAFEICHTIADNHGSIDNITSLVGYRIEANYINNGNGYSYLVTPLYNESKAVYLKSDDLEFNEYLICTRFISLDVYKEYYYKNELPNKVLHYGAYYAAVLVLLYVITIAGHNVAKTFRVRRYHHNRRN